MLIEKSEFLLHLINVCGSSINLRFLILHQTPNQSRIPGKIVTHVLKTNIGSLLFTSKLANFIDNFQIQTLKCQYNCIFFLHYNDSLPIDSEKPLKFQSQCASEKIEKSLQKEHIKWKIHISFSRRYYGFLSEKTMTNFSKQWKNHLHDGSIYFSLEPFPQKVNILGEIIAERSF